jgi:hypothetical protein
MPIDEERRCFLRVKRAHRRLERLREAARWCTEALQERGEIRFAREMHLVGAAESLAEQLAVTLVPLDGSDFDEGDDL